MGEKHLINMSITIMNSKKYIKNSLELCLGIMFMLLFVVSGCSKDDDNVPRAVEVPKQEVEVSTSKQLPLPPVITNRFIVWSERREQLMKEYARIHYGKEIAEIVPQVVIVHWTAMNDCDGVFNYFYSETMEEDGGSILNVASHFLVDRDGTVYRLTPETALNRHAIGYNWCAIGIENVGGEDGKENLTEEQLEANVKLISYLKGKYDTIKYVWGHYQQDKARASGLWVEKMPDYYADKIDPGPIFMGKLKSRLGNDDMLFYEP